MRKYSDSNSLSFDISARQGGTQNNNVNIKIRRKQSQSRSDYSSLFGQLIEQPLEEKDQIRMKTGFQINNEMKDENSIDFYKSTGRLSIDSRKDSFHSCNSDLEAPENMDDFQSIKNTLESKSLEDFSSFSKIYSKKSEDSQLFLNNKKSNSKEDDSNIEDEFKSVNGDAFGESSLISGKLGSDHTEFYTPRQTSLEPFESNLTKNQYNKEINLDQKYLREQNYEGNDYTLNRRESDDSSLDVEKRKNSVLHMGLLKKENNQEQQRKERQGSSLHIKNFSPSNLPEFSIVDENQNYSQRRKMSEGGQKIFKSKQNENQQPKDDPNYNNKKGVQNRAFQSFQGQTPVKGTSPTPFRASQNSKPENGNKSKIVKVEQLPSLNSIQSRESLKQNLLEKQGPNKAPSADQSFIRAEYEKLREKFCYWSIKKSGRSGGIQGNRLVERKNIVQNSDRNNDKRKGRFTLNLTLVISIILEKHPKLAYFLFLNNFVGTITRGIIYFLVIVLSGKDVEFLYAFSPVLFFSRLYYLITMLYQLFYFEQKSESFRRISKIFNTPFQSLRSRQDRNIGEELIDTMQDTRNKSEIRAKRFFAFCPVEINFIALRSLPSGKKSNLFYISNFIYQGIESVLLYPVFITLTCIKQNDSEVVGINFLEIAKYISISGLVLFVYFCSHVLIYGNKYVKID